MNFDLKLECLQTKYDKLEDDLIEKRNSISQLLDKNSKLEQEINGLERQMADTKNTIKLNEVQISDLSQIKNETLKKTEEIIRLKHEHENEKVKREKVELKLEELREEIKKTKQKSQKLQEENTDLKNENIETKSQLNGLKSKLDFIADKSHTELEKNSTLQDQLVEAKKKIDLVESKCATYSQKFDILMKRYEQRKLKHKAKMERLW